MLPSNLTGYCYIQVIYTNMFGWDWTREIETCLEFSGSASADEMYVYWNGSTDSFI